jgi:hypothetical protein
MHAGIGFRKKLSATSLIAIKGTMLQTEQEQEREEDQSIS